MVYIDGDTGKEMYDGYTTDTDDATNHMLEVIQSANVENPIIKSLLGMVDKQPPIEFTIGNTAMKFGFLSMGSISELRVDQSTRTLCKLLHSVDKNGISLAEYELLPPVAIAEIFRIYAEKLEMASEVTEFFRRD